MTPRDIFQKCVASQLKNPISATISERNIKVPTVFVLLQKPIVPRGRYYNVISSLPDIFYLISFRGFKSRFLPSSSSYKTKEEKHIFLFPRLETEGKIEIISSATARDDAMVVGKGEGNDFVRGNRPQGAIKIGKFFFPLISDAFDLEKNMPTEKTTQCSIKVLTSWKKGIRVAFKCWRSLLHFGKAEIGLSKLLKHISILLIISVERQLRILNELCIFVGGKAAYFATG